MSIEGSNKSQQGAAHVAPKASGDLASSTVRSCFAEHKAVRRVLPLFVSDLPPQVAELSNRLAEADLPAVLRLVHGLRGSGGGYGFPDITRLAAAAENLIHAQNDLREVAKAVEDLVDLIRRVDGYDHSQEHTA